MSETYSIELAEPEDLPVLPAIERAAAQLFSLDDLPADVREHATSPEELRAAQQAGRLWVARAQSGRPVGFVLAKALDGAAYLEEMDVLPEHARRGIGRKLVEAVCAWAIEQTFTMVVLTTFRHVAWNAPFYARCGFAELAPEHIAPGLASVLARQTERGMKPENRIAMRLDLQHSGQSGLNACLKSLGAPSKLAILLLCFLAGACVDVLFVKSSKVSQESQARRVLENLPNSSRRASEPAFKLAQPAQVRLMWLPEHITEEGLAVPAHYYYFKIY